MLRHAERPGALGAVRQRDEIVGAAVIVPQFAARQFANEVAPGDLLRKHVVTLETEGAVRCDDVGEAEIKSHNAIQIEWVCRESAIAVGEEAETFQFCCSPIVIKRFVAEQDAIDDRVNPEMFFSTTFIMRNYVFRNQRCKPV